MSPEAATVQFFVYLRVEVKRVISVGVLICYARIDNLVQGDADKFLAEEQLLPRNFEEACKAVGAPLILRMQPGYDHSYYFIATFVDDHTAHHAQFLKSA